MFGVVFVLVFKSIFYGGFGRGVFCVDDDGELKFL